MKKYKTKLSYSDCESIRIVAEDWRMKSPNIATAVTIAALAEVAIVIRKKQVEYKKEYTVTFTAVQAIALCFLCGVVASDHSNQFFNRLMQINNEVRQLYSI